MGNLDSSMGFSVNEDGSITRTNKMLHNNQSPDFIPISLSKFRGGILKKCLFLLYFLLILGVHGSVVGFSVGFVGYNEDVEYYYYEYEKRSIAFQNKDMTNSDYARYSNEDDSYYYHDEYLTPEHSYNRYEGAKDERLGFIIAFSIAIVLAIFLDIKVVPKLLKKYPNKKHILKCADFIQSNLKFNYGFPYIMKQNLIGVLDSKKKKVIIPPDYDVIYWVIPQNVLCAVKDDKQFFYDINGKVLTNVPSSYYTKRSMA